MELVEFLLKAKTCTYASGAEGVKHKLPDGSLELTFQEADFAYRDRYFGSNPFVGEEIVFQGGKAIWAMNYYGQMVSETVSAKKTYSFLQKALRLAKAERPFRGPHLFVEQNFEYNDESSGSISTFSGTERVFYKGIEVYRLEYHGGVVNY